jgi:hypothetical protein
MSKLIPMEQAASMLGMSVDQINELRSNQEIFGYKDGGTWKFKMTELERVADNLGVSLGGASDVAGVAKDKVEDIADDFGLDFGDSEELLLDDDSSGDSMELDIEDSSIELMQSPLKGSGASDVLSDQGVTLQDSGLLDSGTSKDQDKKDEAVVGESGSLKLQDSGEIGDSGSLKLGDSGVLDLGGSDILDDDQLSFGTSDISLASESSKKLKSDDTGSDVLDEAVAGKGSPSDTGKMLGESNNDDLMLAEDDLFEDDLVLQDSASFEDSSDLGSDFDESDLILDDSDSSSELALEANKSGISLSPNESGISLGDEPLELGGSDIDELELPEDDDMIILEDAADPEAATMMQEDDFNLTPLEQSLDGEDSSGSSSQVIALEDSEIYADESSATILGESGDFGAEPALIEDDMGMVGVGVGGAMIAGGAMMEPGMMQAGPAGPPESPYTLLNVLALGGAALILFLGSILTFDMCRNLWMGDGQVVSSGFLDFVITSLGMKN